MCIQKDTCVRPRQELVGQPLTFWRNPQLLPFVTHTCVCVLTAANGLIGLPKLLNVQNLHMTSSLDSCAAHMCVFPAASGRPGRS